MKPLRRSSICFLLIASVLLSLLSTVQNARSPQDKVEIEPRARNVEEESDNARRVPAKRPLKRQMSIELYKSKECRDDLFKYCPIARDNELNDLAVMQCFYDKVPDLSVLDEECQNKLYSFKKNLTINLRLDTSAIQVCSTELEKLTECKNVDSDMNGHLISCLLDNANKVTDAQCKSFLNNVAALVFSDYRLIYKFHDDCQSDIERLKCGRLEKHDEELPTQQGKTIECLSNKYQELDDTCKKQIVRIIELQSEDFHLDRTLFFACRDDRENLCPTVSSGDGRVYKCLMKNKFNPLMSKACQEQLTRRQRVQVDNVDADRNFVRACKTDILQNECRAELRNDASQNVQLASLLLCLEKAMRNGVEVNADCRVELLEHRKMLMSDYSLSPNVVKFCENEIKTMCNNGIEKGGKTLHCLFKNAKKSKLGRTDNNFSDKCLSELRFLVKVVDIGEDVRIDPHLQQSCQNLLTGPCKDVQAGNGQVVQCLTKFIGSQSISEDCEERLLELQFFMARDWKLNPQLFRACKVDAVNICQASDANDWTVSDEKSQLVLPCLFHHIHEADENDESEESRNKISDACVFEVKKLLLDRAKSIDLIPEIQEKCTSDLAQFCSGANTKTSGKGEELRCLQENIKNLGEECKQVVSAITADQSKDIRLDQILMNSCLPTIEEFCSDKRDEKGELLECLIRQKNNPKIQYKCRIGIEHHQLLNLEDVSFNYKFKKACKSEIDEHCMQFNKQKLSIIHCLSEMVLNDTLLDKPQRVHDMCRQQLRFELFQMNENIKLDPELYDSCREDMRMLCANTNSGKGNMLECLKTNQKKLSKPCYLNLFKREKMNLVDQTVDYNLQTRCKNAIQTFCHVDSEQDVLGCLRKHLLEPTLDTSCRLIVINRLMIQNKDARFNPSLWKACFKDVNVHCRNELAGIDLKDLNQALEGRLLTCLKKRFVNDKLSKQCSAEVEQVMREAANVDYRLDPLLADACLSEIERFCADESNDKKEDCLRLSFQKGRIDPNQNPRCFEEVRRIIVEGAADVFIDHELSQICSTDLARFCNEIPPGASQQLKCLLNTKNVKGAKLSESCAEALENRQELWKMAEVQSSLQGINDLARLINESESRSYLFGIFFMLVSIIFVLGCMCRSAVFKHRHNKLK